MSSPSIEDIKGESGRLRGSLLESLADPTTGALRESDQTLIKYHGSYQQDDRDLREERRRQKLEPAYQFMIRTRTPGGVITPQQWLQLDTIATRYANHSLRVTTRQAFQFHGVIKRELKATMQAINAALIDTLAACGDVNRNVQVAANPLLSRAHADLYADAAYLSEHLLPNTRAYYEIWLDEKKVAGAGEEDEPIYGPRYLPRKFKIGFAAPPINDVDVFANDLGFIAVIVDGRLLGYNVAIGGGMGTTHGDPDTWPRVGNIIGFIARADLIAIGTAVVTTQRDLGNRTLRKRARFKYTIDDRGLDFVTDEIQRRAGVALQPAQPFSFEHNGDRYGWIEGENGHWHLTLSLPAGRIADTEGSSLLSGFRAIATLSIGEFRMTPNQNVVIAGISATRRAEIDALVTHYGLDIGNRAPTALARTAMACVAFPTCGLAMAEAERYLPDFNAKLQPMLEKYGLAETPILLRISGCPNGCSRPYLAEIALVGKAYGRYNLMLGGDQRGQRLNTLYRENITETEILAALEPLLGRYQQERLPSEGFGDFLHRTGIVALPSYPTHRHVISSDLQA
ncbi:assimilatory sulfite reductase (NADPH) hemoprotein subunit [Xylella taiwanensis]|uniref:Sulfite reductase [NADPH] hemoprotein beta-component n=1 Tax=Xylella taiwanensis TaxID=1444770 RepID=Z9JHI4_9GAMM|nr:assimilatory sulfite reductase (NADPH) hemoprotein subunit [Xylella taiwanensis]AXI83874.1 sulfite reductase [Xylella taiwanensis]EWS77624.1 sulfite reductase [Xylella taiwanensis]MCD8456978.1 assimilatory sulfite reductase (NADPH) hemoprotein subunit [Xylella taiwanensis]MCD8459389.1 assimilatory sulfite reductase (NADPH) hemoprotein subunit [Xylella taiwanensis]MCD8461740.1 assimilatory sulfite reductase (NADPH) hemoprotein subunit [Xylella taiwanensis]